jgi:hypothetical protein
MTDQFTSGVLSGTQTFMYPVMDLTGSAEGCIAKPLLFVSVCIPVIGMPP